jgi:hypothetical protein
MTTTPNGSNKEHHEKKKKKRVRVRGIGKGPDKSSTDLAANYNASRTIPPPTIPLRTAFYHMRRQCIRETYANVMLLCPCHASASIHVHICEP